MRASRRLPIYVAVTSALTFASTPLAADKLSIITFVSNSRWAVLTALPRAHSFGLQRKAALGVAQPVCLNATAPASCPPDAILYDYPGGGWSADLSSVPGAEWVWAPGITGDSEADLAHFFFARQFVLQGQPTSSFISVAADDFAAVWVNGVEVGRIGSIVDIGLAGEAQSTLHTFDITAYLKPGRNIIVIEAQNGPASFAGGECASCSYSQNPAGVVFGGVLAVR